MLIARIPPTRSSRHLLLRSLSAASQGPGIPIYYSIWDTGALGMRNRKIGNSKLIYNCLLFKKTDLSMIDLNKFSAIICPTSAKFSGPTMPAFLFLLQHKHMTWRMVVGVFSKTMISADSMNVPSKCWHVRASENHSSRAYQALYHAVCVRVYTL